MIRAMIRTITGKYHLNAITLGEFSRMKVNGMQFDIWAFHAEGLGHVSAMTATGFFGLIKMDTLIINPKEKDMPLFSYNRIQTMGNDTLIFELFDTTLEEADLRNIDEVKSHYDSLPDHDLGHNWYDPIRLSVSMAKKAGKGSAASFNKCAMEYLDSFLKTAESAPFCDPAGKREKASVYVEGLLTNGSPSTEVFKKSLGAEKTEFLFRHFLFGTTR